MLIICLIATIPGATLCVLGAHHKHLADKIQFEYTDSETDK